MSFPGDLEPPGPPEPTMKTLVDVEPRIPIYTEDLPLTITEPGSYYLAEDIYTSGEGIKVNTESVAIDLMGHTLTGGTGTGIEALNGKITVKNGTVTSWSSHGVYLGKDSSVSQVRSLHNTGNGITVAYRSSVSESVSAFNGSDGIWIQGGLVRDCIAKENQGNGIYAQYGVTILDCQSGQNNRNGIRVDNNTTVRGNHCNENGGLYDKSGIFVHGSGNRIDGNTVRANSRYGIEVEDTGNTVHRNAATENDVGEYSFVTGNDVGPIGPSATATSPWANITY
jgi:parallel beta-helix repeat protein